VENSFTESVEVEVVRLLKELELPVLLSSKYGSGAATEATVVNSGYIRVVVREFMVDFVFCYGEADAWFFGDLRWRCRQRVAAVSSIFGVFLHFYLF
jgi:hypothetical protein